MMNELSGEESEDDLVRLQVRSAQAGYFHVQTPSYRHVVLSRYVSIAVTP